MKKFALIVSLLLLLLLPMGTAVAAPLFDTVVEDGETIDNDVTVLDGDLEIQEGATVNGSVTVFSGDMFIAGTVRGDVVVFSGDLEAAETAVIRGDCIIVSGDIEDNTERGLNCTTISGLNVPNFVPPGLNFTTPEVPNVPDAAVRHTSPAAQFFGGLALTIGQSLLMAFLAFAVAALVPQKLARVEETVKGQPFASGAIGTLTGVSVPFVIVILAVLSGVLVLACGLGLLGFPVVFAVIVAYIVAIIFGWITVGHLLGQRLAGWLNLSRLSMPFVAALGTAVLTFSIGMLGVGPFDFFEFILSVLVVCVGLGAVALTQFGTRPYPRMLSGVAGKVMATIDPQVDAAKETAVLNTLPDNHESA